jgi:formate C-acetyltransferase
MDKCCELAQQGVGMPAFFNDEVIVPLLVRAGCTLEEARGYAEVGCVEPQAPGKTEGLYSGGFMNLCKVLEITLGNGVNPSTGTVYSKRTGTEFADFEEFYSAYRQQLEHFVKMQADADNFIDEAHSKMCPTPLVSCFVDDCIADGVDIRCGGAKYNYTSPNIVGLANAADALAVIKKKVFEDKTYTLDAVRKLLDENFDGNETVRQEFLKGVPKYGNDDPYVDDLARRVAADYCDIVREQTNFRGGRFEPGLQSISAHAMFVGTMGATPDGRLATDLVSDGGVSPAQGRDVCGATAVIKSVARLDHTKATNGALLNIKFHPSAVQGEKGIQILSALVNSYFNMGGQHVQFNVVSSEVLRDAQKNPDNYRDLVVRVAGFSVLYTALDRVLQNDIIERTENSV